jgi:hypothetical protein
MLRKRKPFIASEGQKTAVAAGGDGVSEAIFSVSRKPVLRAQRSTRRVYIDTETRT